METQDERFERIEAHREAQTCSICNKHLDYADGCYTITHTHWDCQYPNGYKSPLERFEESAASMDKAMSDFGIKPKRKCTRLGTGGPTKKLISIIEISAKEQFETDNVRDIEIYLAPPVWRQSRFDVMSIEGSITINERKIVFGAWEKVTELIKYKRVKFDDDFPNLNMSPDYDTKRTRNKNK